MIPITEPYFPSKRKYKKLLNQIWSEKILTNNGHFLKRFESKLSDSLNMESCVFVANGTLALQLAIKALKLKGNEIITTPFSYIATTASIVWENFIPVFVDIDIETFNINPDLIENSLTDQTSAILVTHVFGNPCDIDAIYKIATRHKLKVIYDASHCFGSKYKGHDIFNFGDVSTLSLHATKIIHSVEGGAIFSKNIKLLERTSFMRGFGHDGPYSFNGLGINAKNSELHAAMGLLVLEERENILNTRKKQYLYYKNNLVDTSLKLQKTSKHSEINYSYFPIIFESESQLIKTFEKLSLNNIFPRRYFYPLLSNLDFIKHKGSHPNAEFISKRVLCLPLFHNLNVKTQDNIISIIKNQLLIKHE